MKVIQHRGQILRINEGYRRIHNLTRCGNPYPFVGEKQVKPSCYYNEIL